ncbi:MAG: DNA polymerase III subunit beta [Firmicutes bacterium]|nr:DNA polymerase III subunit beta [Bacillota bacterium]
MKFVIDKNILLEALTNVTRAIGTRTTIPILNGIKFDLTSEGLSLLASDSELTIKILIPEKDIKNIEKCGSMIIQSKYILEIIRKMPSDTINFESIDSSKIKIYTDNNEYNLNCYDISDYPHISLEESKEPISIKADTLKSIINETSYAVSTQEVRPLLTGINLKITGDMLECIATDSYRLAKKNIKLDAFVNATINIVIPGKSINEFEKMLTTDEEIIMHIFNNKILFKYRNIQFQTNLLSGTYPDTNHFIPSEFAYMINLNLKAFNDAVDRASLLAQSKDKNIVRVLIDDKTMVISSSASEIGKTEEKLIIECSNKEKLEIAFSSRYMLEALKVIKDDNILLLVNSDDKPILIKSVKDESLLELILPVKTY